MLTISSQKEFPAPVLESSLTNDWKKAEDARSSTILKRNRRQLSTMEYCVVIGAFLLMLAGAILVYTLQPDFEKLYLERIKTSWGTALIFVGTGLVAIKIAFLLYLVSLYRKYKPIQSVPDSELPTCTVIVPAYNEGELVWHTLLSLAESDYPKEKLQLIAIDDGSVDDTWEWMQLAKDRLCDNLYICRQPRNMGKRQALHRGFNLGTGEIFVTVDSDSVVERDTLRNLVSPFSGNPDCGAVAGNVKVLNKKSIIPRMLNVSFAFNFEFVRAAQSVTGAVLCTPGALAAYRREAVLNCLPEWINQMFMGQESDIGEDRAMTNMILKQGYDVSFQKNAIVYTNTPEKYKGLYKMLIRWERSNVRESLMMSKFAFTKFRKGSALGARIFLLNQCMNTLLSYPATFLMLFLLLTQPILFISSTLLGTLLFSSIQVLFYAWKHNVKESFWAYPYVIFHTFTLFWITPYSIATVKKRGWLTRDIPFNNKKQYQYLELEA